MTDIHSCSYYCDRPECIKAQRDEARRTVREAHEAGARVTAQRDELLKALMLCQQASLHKHILNTGESLASVVDAAIKAMEKNT